MMYEPIGRVAKRVGVSEETLRRWEAVGLIPQAQRQFINKWRVWEEEDVKKIERVAIERAKRWEQ